MTLADLLPAGMTPVDAAALLSGAAALLVVTLVWRALIEVDHLPARLKALDRRRDELRGDLSRKTSHRTRLDVRASPAAKLGQRFASLKGARAAALQLRLAQAGFRSAEAQVRFGLARVLTPIVVGALVAVMAYGGAVKTPDMAKPFIVLLAAGVSVLLPDLWIANLAQKRREAIRKQLPDTFDLLVICAEAGLSLHSALDRVSKESMGSSPELADELALTALELSFLPDRNKALSGLGDRVPLPGIRALVNTFLQTERYGTPLAQALRVLSFEMREERMLKAEEKAARLPAILTVPMIIFILPPLFIVLIGPAILRTIDNLSRI